MALLSALMLENYRTFQKRASFDLEPLTLITGPNSSGKSSILKALLFLRYNARLGRLHEPVFGGGDHNLGSFRNARSRGSESDIITIGVAFDWDNLDQWNYNYPVLDQSYAEWENGTFDNEIGHIYFELGYKDRGDHVGLSRLLVGTGKKGEKPMFEIEADVFRDGDEVFYRYVGKVYGNWFFASFEAAWHALGYFAKFPSNDTPLQDLLRQTIERLQDETEQNIDDDLHNAVLTTAFLANTQSFEFSDVGKRVARPLPLSQLVRRAGSVRTWSSDVPAEKAFNYREVYDVRRVYDEFFRPYLARWIEYLELKLSEIDYAAPLRAVGKRIYAYDEENAFVRLLQQISSSPMEESEQARLRKLLLLFGLGDRIDIEPVAEAGYTLRLRRGDEVYSLADLGYGYAQLLPLILYAAFESRSSFPTFLVEEPEANLHPNFQARLADLLTAASAPAESHLLVETHSEYLVRRLQYLVAKGDMAEDRVAIYYLGGDPAAEDYIRRITIDKNGRLSQDFGPGFIDEATTLMVALYKHGRQN